MGVRGLGITKFSRKKMITLLIKINELSRELRSVQCSCANFQAIVRQNFSRKYQPNGPNEYVTALGHRIQFVPNPSDNKYVWGIQAIDGKSYDTNIGDWPLAAGDIINSCEHDPCQPGEGRDGFMTIDNPLMGERLILDFRDVMNPKRSEVIYKKVSEGALPIRKVQ